MKFNKTLESDLVPEWKTKYLDYKQCKKKLKAVARAVRSVDQSPSKTRASPYGTLFFTAPVRTLLNQGTESDARPRAMRSKSDAPSPTWRRRDEVERAGSVDGWDQHVDERSPLQPRAKVNEDGRPPSARYGSVLGSPSGNSSPIANRLSLQPTEASLLELPNPALDSERSSMEHDRMPNNPEYDWPIGPGSPQQTREKNREVIFREAEFFVFLEKELAKIELFYAEKERDATQRLQVLRDQLHIMRKHQLATPVSSPFHLNNNNNYRSNNSFHYSPTNRDYLRQTKVSYRSAKRQLKAAFIEYYRELELLKNFILLNHTAFRKIAKKCDKTVHSGTPGKTFITNRVEKAAFVTSKAVDDLQIRTEDYYARYFELGNRKMATSRLRSRGYQTLDHSYSTERACLLAGAGIIMAILGLVSGFYKSFELNRSAKEADTSFLLQLYAGYFLEVLQVTLFFRWACWEFRRHQINHAHIFELDSRSNLHLWQLLEFPALFIFLLGACMLLNFTGIGGPPMYNYWPVVLIGLTVLTIILPAPIFYHHTRLWFLKSLGRVFCFGLFPVEFRDLFIGDMLCSQTYLFGNIYLFFCLYGKHWGDGSSQCTSKHSMAFGFFTTIPAIMRACQCVRRSITTKSAMPHLANFGKYVCTIVSYIALSQFRIHGTVTLEALFIVLSTANSLYCSWWDIYKDFDLGDRKAKHRFLRSELLFDYIWCYYALLLIDPVLRFNWIFYVIFMKDVQHSTIVSFSIALSEVLRRAIWAVIRIENEQITNNQMLRASNHMRLPYPTPDGNARIRDYGRIED